MNDIIATACIVCGRTQDEDAGGEIRHRGQRQIFVCSKCLQAWKMSELWNSSRTHRTSRELFIGPDMDGDSVESTVEAILRRDIKEKDVADDGGDVDSDDDNHSPNFDISAENIKKELDRWVVGQENAKIAIATIAHRHYMGVRHRRGGNNCVGEGLKRQVAMMVGPTGCGKSLIAKKLGDILGVPWIIPSAAHFTEEGYHGNSVNEALQMLISKTNGDGSEEWGLVCWDEIDKKAMREVGGRRDVSGLGVQQALLDHLDSDGTEIDISTGRNGESYMFDNTDVFTVLTGAFSDDLRGGDDVSTGGIGFGVDTSLWVNEDRIKIDNDIERYGFIPEFCSRIGHIVVLDPLTKSEMKSILLDVDDAPIPAAKEVAREYGFTLNFDESALDALVDEAIESGKGARKLRHMVERSTINIFYEAPDRVARRKSRPRITVTADTVHDPSVYSVS